MSDPFGEEKPPLPPPFHSGGKKSKEDEAKGKTPAAAFRVGTEDVRPMFGGGLGPAGEEGGMLVGPGHPGFWNRPPHPESYRPSPTLLPPYKEAFRYLELHEQLGLMSAWLRGAVPPGARFDPITPIDPTGGEAPGWPSGEPDPDAEPILGPRVDPVRPGWRPPKRPPGGGPFEGGSGSGGPFDSGGPPFFR